MVPVRFRLTFVSGFAVAAISAAMLTACGGGGAGEEAVGYFTPRAGAVAPLSGAIFTSEAGCTATNINTFASKADVYLSGGPAQPNAAGLAPNADYWVKVTDPSGAVVLGSSPGADVRSDANGRLPCVRLADIVQTGVPAAPGFADSPNGGGVYKVWVSLSSDFDGAKTDNFKIGAAPAPDAAAEIQIKKWYDTNTNGQWDVDETAVTGWKVDIAGLAQKFTPATYTGTADGLALGWSIAQEFAPAEGSSRWVATNAYREGSFAINTLSAPLGYLNQLSVELTAGVPTATVNFGNVCLGAGNGHTLGFWSNKNGKKAIEDAGVLITDLNSWYLRDATGALVTLSDHPSLETFLRGGTATNMAHMLSVQMATMWLNVHAGGVAGSGMVYGRIDGVSDPVWLNAQGFVSVTDLLDAAKASLTTNGFTPSGHPARADQERIKNLLDSLNNNNQLYVQPAASCVVVF